MKVIIRFSKKGAVLVELALVLLLLLTLISAIIDTAWVIKTADLAKEAVRYDAREKAASGECDPSASKLCSSFTSSDLACQFLSQAGFNLNEWNYSVVRNRVGYGTASNTVNGVYGTFALVTTTLTFQGTSCVFCLRRFFQGAVPPSSATFLIQAGCSN